MNRTPLRKAFLDQLAGYNDELCYFLFAEAEIDHLVAEPGAYLADESVYGFYGKQLGWYDNGAVYDHDGYVVAAPASMLQGAVEPGKPRAHFVGWDH